MKVLFETPYFDLVKIENKHGFHMKIISVAILPYTVNESGIIDKIGVLHEWNQLREGNYADTLITGTIEDTDADAYETAVRELYEEGGIDLRNDSNEAWTFLGNFNDSKDSDREYPTFAVNVTGKELTPPTTDGSEKEEKSSLKMVSVNEALQSNETLLLAAFLRLFNIMYQKSFNNAK
jgi:8-oxo-dGTP pyrophosphatase MutT (NUDIX family)